jgi:hypothetical protein
MNYPSKAVQAVLAKALVDKDFRHLLYTDRKKALAAFDPNYSLSADDSHFLDAVPQDKIEEIGQHAVALIAAAAVIANPPQPPPPTPPAPPPPPAPPAKPKKPAKPAKP